MLGDTNSFLKLSVNNDKICKTQHGERKYIKNT